MLRALSVTCIDEKKEPVLDCHVSGAQGKILLNLVSGSVVVPRGFWFGLGSELCSSRGYIKVVAVYRQNALGLWIRVNQVGECGLSSLQRRTAQQKTVVRMAML